MDKHRKCYYLDSHPDWDYNPCGFSMVVDGELQCHRDDKKLREWGCLYKCEDLHPKQIQFDL